MHVSDPLAQANGRPSRGSASEPDLAARRLIDAAAQRQPCHPVRDILGENDIALAYRAQEAIVIDRLQRGGVITGRKIGLTAPAVQQQLGVNQPDFGVLFADMDVSSMDRIPAHLLLQPKVEAEIAFGLSRDLDIPDIDIAALLDSVEWAAAALEIVDSRIANWDIRITDTIADNASSGLYVLSNSRIPLRNFVPKEVTMRLCVDDVPASEGTGAACMGDPLEALLWLAQTARQYGRPLQAGQVVLSGALGAMVAVAPGSKVTAEISSLGEVSAWFGDRDEFRS